MVYVADVAWIPALLWLWQRPVATALIRLPAWEPPYAVGAALENTINKQTNKNKFKKERKIPYGITYIWNLIYSTSEHFHRKETHGRGEQTWQGGGSGMDWEFGLIDENYCFWNG